MTYYGTMATAAGWIVPKKYMEQVGDDGFRKHPIGLGPSNLVGLASHRAHHGGRRGLLAQGPSCEAAGLENRPGRYTRMAMLKRGEVDIAYYLEVLQHAEEVNGIPGSA